MADPVRYEAYAAKKRAWFQALSPERRDELRIATGFLALGPKAFEQCAGFLRINGGSDPLDASGVHPESYPVVRKILEATKSDIKQAVESLFKVRVVSDVQHLLRGQAQQMGRMVKDLWRRFGHAQAGRIDPMSKERTQTDPLHIGGAVADRHQRIMAPDAL